MIDASVYQRQAARTLIAAPGFEIADDDMMLIWNAIGLAGEAGEVAATVFDRYRDPLYKQASFKPYVIAAMIFLAKTKNPAEMLKQLEKRGDLRHLGI